MGEIVQGKNILYALRSVIQEVNAARGLRDALQIIVKRVKTIMEVQVCSVYLQNAATQRYVFMATEGLNKEQEGKFSLPLSESLVGLVAQREEPVNLEDAQSHPRFRFVPDIGEDEFFSFLGVPIVHQRQVLGVLVVQQNERRRFDEDDEAFLITLSAQLAGIIAHELAGNLSFDAGSADLLTINQQNNLSYKGLSGSRGVALGQTIVINEDNNLYNVSSRQVDCVGEQLSLFHKSLHAAKNDISFVASQLSDRLAPEEQALFDVYISMLDDSALAKEVISKIEQGEWAQGAWAQVILEHVSKFEMMEDEYFKERATDVKDLGVRVLKHLRNVDAQLIDYPDDTILCSHEVTPSMLAEVPPEKLKGIVSVRGSNNSHVAILARSMGVPVVMGVSSLPVKKLEKQLAVVDANNSLVLLNPDMRTQAHYSAIIKKEQHASEHLESIRDLPCETTDGHSIKLYINAGLYVDSDASKDQNVQGVGLYRTEIPFLLRDRFPSEEEQRQLYFDQLKTFKDLPVTMRTLDIGGDKALDYFPIEEANPFLGWRGIRVTLDHPEIFLAQVRAMLKASAGLNNLQIMLPMISHVEEVDEASGLITRAVNEVQEEGFDIIKPPIGVMIEVPAAVYQAEALAEKVDFLSVGSNDLTQYLLAVDRNNTRVASLYHSLHPAVLQACMQVAQAAKSQSRALSICGELAADPASAILLLAMGYDILSMNVTSLLPVKDAVRQVSLNDAKRLLDYVLLCRTSNDVVQYLRSAFKEMGMEHVMPSESTFQIVH